MQKFRTDPIVQTNASRNVVYVSSDFFSEISNFIDKRDLCCQKRIRGILDQFCGPALRVHDRGIVQIQWPVYIANYFTGPFVVSTHHYSIGKLEITDRRAFAKKFRV